MRGRLRLAELRQAADGNTPAYAGKTKGFKFIVNERGKHPRVCGEDRYRENSAFSVKETPPRMRGRLLPEADQEPNTGNTPAYAGKTLPPGSADS